MLFEAENICHVRLVIALTFEKALKKRKRRYFVSPKILVEMYQIRALSNLRQI